MLRTRSVAAQGQRRGFILLVVVWLLTLFLIVGLSFVFYANSCKQAARLQLEAEAPRPADVEPERLLSYFLGQLLYDVPDDEGGIYSGMRGHSPARNMFGANYLIDRNGDIQRNALGELVDAAGNVLNDVPFNGTGRLHYDARLPITLRLPPNHSARDNYNLINYTYFPDDGFLRDPERRGWRTKP